MTESYSNHSILYKYYTSGAEVPTNFNLMEDHNSTPEGFQRAIEEWITKMPFGSTFNSVVKCIIIINANNNNNNCLHKMYITLLFLNTIHF